MLHTHDYKSIHDFKTLGNHKYENSAFQAEIQQNDRNEPQTHVHQEVADGGGMNALMAHRANISTTPMTVHSRARMTQMRTVE